MGSKLINGAIWWFLCMGMIIRQSNGADFDVKKYGAKADGKSDDSQAMVSAWKEACASADPSRVVIAKGNYMVGPVKFEGPCKAPITILAQGDWKAPTDVRQFESQDGWIVLENIDGLTLSGGGSFDGQGGVAWQQNDCAKTGKCNSLPINIRFNSISNSMIQDITSLNSKLFHMNFLGCKNITLQQITINAPPTSINTDGIHIGRSTGINIVGADIRTGDDCVSLGDGSQQINIEKVNCGPPGHGISVGSLGKYPNELPVIGVTVTNCTLTNTMNGIRVKTWPASPSGIASNLHFQNLVMNNVSTPILIDQQYCPYGQCKAELPSRVKITNVSFKDIQGTSATKLAVKLVCSRGTPCRNVKLSGINLAYNGNNGSAISQCANVEPAVTGQVFPPACAAQAPQSSSAFL